MSALDRDAAATSPDLDDVKWSPLKVVAKMRDLRLHVVFQSERGEFEWGIHGAGGWPLGLGASSSLEDAKAAVVHRARELLTTTGPRWPKPNVPHEVPCKWLGRAMHIDCWLREDDGRILATAFVASSELCVLGTAESWSWSVEDLESLRPIWADAALDLLKTFLWKTPSYIKGSTP